jgi:ectoine hydroxylase-related dioxygenase (phytanoyl-CoA dioxygenase family)
MTSATHSYLREALDEDGFVIVHSALSSQELQKLREASKEAVTLAREGGWPYLRTLPKQFPPWSSSLSNGIWGIQHLLHPEIPGHELFAANYFSDTIISIVKEILQCDEDDLVMELFNLLIRPDEDFELRWHRDDIPDGATATEEVERLKEPAWHAQWNLALYDDQSLIVVPGSHLRARTNEELKAGPFEPNMPGQLIVKVRGGDVVLYNNNILHRGVYSKDVERMTLHGSMGHVQGSGLRARNVLQHGVGEWAEKMELKGLPNNERAEGMRKRLIKLGSERQDVGFAHPD